jgi:hypothetical protein
VPLTIDLGTKVVPQTARIWALFPGLGRRYLNFFLEHSVVFLDLPALRLTRVALADRDILRRHVAMSEAIARWYRRGGGAEFPSRNPATYDPRRADLITTLSHVRRFFTEVQVGDLVAVGGTLYQPVYFVEVIEPFDPAFSVQVQRYGEEQIHALKVRWHRSRKERRELSPTLSRQLSNRKALTEISKIVFGPEVYSEAYGDYVVDTYSRYVIEGDDYHNDGNQLLDPLQIISYFIAAFNASEEGVVDEFVKYTLEEARIRFYESDLLNALEVDFKSPGAFTIFAKKAALPLFVATCLYCATQGVSLEEARAAEIVNSVAPADPCTIEVDTKYKELMRTMGLEKWEEVCRRAQKAKGDINLETRINRRRPGAAR